MKRILSLLLILMLTLFLTIPSCGKSEAIHGNESVPSKHEDISIAFWGIDAMDKEADPDGVLSYIQRRFNITIDPFPVTWSNYRKRYEVLSMTDSLPDVFATTTLSSSDPDDSSVYEKMITEGKIRALPSDLSKWPNVQSAVAAMPSARWRDDKYYLIPRLSFSDASIGISDAAMLVRKDWRKALGLAQPESFEDFAAMVCAFAQDDPDGDGKDDTFGYNVNIAEALGKWVILGIAPKCNTFSWVEQDGKYFPSWISSDFIRVIDCYRDLYDEGGLDPEFYCKAPKTVIEDFAAGRLGALEFKFSPAALRQLMDRWDAYHTESFRDCVEILPVFPASDGVRYSNSSNNVWSESYINASVSDEKLERILDLYEYLLSDEGEQLTSYGLKDIDYEVSSSGTITSLIPLENGQRLNSVLLSRYPSLALFASLAEWEDQDWNSADKTDFYTLKYGSTTLAMARDALFWHQKNTTQVQRPIDFLNTPTLVSDVFTGPSAHEEFILCIIGEENAVDMWNSYVDDLRAQGLNDYIEKQNALYEELLRKNKSLKRIS